MIKTLASAVAIFATAVTAHAQPLNANYAGSIDLGTTRGTAYYVAQPNGYHLIATLSSGAGSSPIRFDTMLSDGQSASVSIPGPVGTQPQEVVFIRSAGHLEVRESTEFKQDATQ